MSGSNNNENQQSGNNNLVIDNVLTTQPELGPTVPEGGYGWIVLLITLFFQILIPSLICSYGIFLAFSRFKTDIITNSNPKLWDHDLLYTPLFFIIAWTLFDPTSRQFIIYSIWPKLFAISGTCLICAGMLFLWIAMTGDNSPWLYGLSGTVSGIGASIQMSQCEILLAQYFKYRLPMVVHLGHAVSALGFIIAPLILGTHLLLNSQTQVILWYQALILQGLVLNLFLRKPMYLKSKSQSNYRYVTANPEDEEDIFSRNARELQIKATDSGQIETHTLPIEDGSATSDEVPKPIQPWVKFEDQPDPTYAQVHQWETFNEEELKSSKAVTKNWEKFEDEPTTPTRNARSLHLEMAFENTSQPTTESTDGLPTPLFSDTPVNNNNTYSFEALDDPSPDGPNSSVFMPTVSGTIQQRKSPLNSKEIMELLRTPTFYKSCLTVITTKWSLFTFFALYPSFLFQEVTDLRLKQVTNLLSGVCVAILLFTIFSYWINTTKRYRAKAIWFTSWFGALGYFMISDYFSEGALLFGAIMIATSLAALQHIGTPLLGLTIKGEATKEYVLISAITGISFLIFFSFNLSFKYMFRLMAIFNFGTGCLWLSNYIYKRLRR